MSKSRVGLLTVCLLACLACWLPPCRALAASPAADSLDEVYVAPTVLGNGTEGDPTSWQMALKWVKDGGTIYIMDDSVRVKTKPSPSSPLKSE